LTEDHALKNQLSADQIQTYLACGDIAGALDVDGALIVGIKEPVYAGIAYFVPAADGSTSFSVMIAQVVGDEADGAVSVAATVSQATPAATGATDASPQLIDVSLTNFGDRHANGADSGPGALQLRQQRSRSAQLRARGGERQEDPRHYPAIRKLGQAQHYLAPGIYMIFCPVGEGVHRAQGMELELRAS